MPVDHASASLALALALQEQEYQQARHGTGAASRAATNHATSGASRAAARRVEAAELRRHLYDGTPSETPAPPPCTPKGLSYAKAASALGEARPELARSAPAPTMQPAMAVQSRPRARRPTCGVSAEIRLLLDGANVAFRFGEANGRGGIFEWRGLRLCVEYFVARGVALSAIAAVVNENRWDPEDANLAWLDARHLVAWTPTAKDDDLFVLTAAADQTAWVVTNDRWNDHGRNSRQARDAVRRRTIRFSWMRGVFAPAADDLGRFGRAEAIAGCGR